jgi:hypothetical protein
MQPSLHFLFPILLAASAAAQQPIFRRIAVHGDQAPGTPAGVTFFNTSRETSSPSPPSIDDAGNVSFHAVLTGPGITPFFQGNSEAIYKHVAGRLSLIARQTDPAPGTAPGVLFQGFPIDIGPRAAIISAGRALFAATLRGPGVNEFFTGGGSWTDRSGSLELFLRQGDPLPGEPAGSVLEAGLDATIDTAGRIAFNAFFRAPGAPPQQFLNNEGIWSERSGSLERLIAGGDPAPGAGAGITFGESAFFAIGGAFRSWAQDASGRIALHGNLSGPGIDDLNDEGIWIERSAGLQLLIREGGAAPGFGPPPAVGRIGIVSGIDAFGSRFPLDVNDAGQLLFMARVDPPGQVSFAEGVYVLRDTSLELIAEARDASASEPGPTAPGLAPGMYFHRFGWGNLSNAGRVVLMANTTNHGGTIEGSGIWWDQFGPLSKLAANGDQVPGQLPGVVYVGNFQIGPLTADGVLLFAAIIGGPGLSNRTAIFLADNSGTPHAVLMPGQQIDTALPGSPPQLRTVSGFLVGAMNESGEMAFKTIFTDNTIAAMTVSLPAPCYPNCDNSTAAPILNVQDFTCFLQRYAAGNSYANCDNSTQPPVLNVQDFTCFLQQYAAGCP